MHDYQDLIDSLVTEVERIRSHESTRPSGTIELRFTRDVSNPIFVDDEPAVYVLRIGDSIASVGYMRRVIPARGSRPECFHIEIINDPDFVALVERARKLDTN